MVIFHSYVSKRLPAAILDIETWTKIYVMFYGIWSDRFWYVDDIVLWEPKSKYNDYKQKLDDMMM